jgi:hypothetical protein
MTFFVGKSDRPRGRPPLPEWLKEVKKIAKDEFELRIARILQMKLTDIKSMAEDPGAIDACDACIASIIAKAVTTGDQSRLDWLAKTMILGVDQNATSGTSSMEEYKKRYMDYIDQKKLSNMLREKESETCQEENSAHVSRSAD